MQPDMRGILALFNGAALDHGLHIKRIAHSNGGQNCARKLHPNALACSHAKHREV